MFDNRVKHTHTGVQMKLFTKLKEVIAKDKELEILTDSYIEELIDIATPVCNVTVDPFDSDITKVEALNGEMITLEYGKIYKPSELRVFDSFTRKHLA